MADLAQLSLARAGLPTIPGATAAERLMNGRDMAAAALRKYTTLAFDPLTAGQTLREIEVWQEQNRDQLSAVMSDPSTTSLPDRLRITFGPGKAQQYIVAQFTQAAVGLGPYFSGKVDVAAATGQIVSGVPLSPDWKDVDTELRIQVFAGIVKMDNDGYLGKLFVPGGTQGLGLEPFTIVTIAVVVTIVAIAALIVMWSINSKKLDQNNKIMGDLCKDAQKNGDAKTVAACIQATADLQKGSIFGDLFQQLGTALMWVGVAYVGVVYGLPLLLGGARRQSTALALPNRRRRRR